MRPLYLLFALLLLNGALLAQKKDDDTLPAIADKVKGATTYEGFFSYHWDARAGKIWLEVDKIGEEFLYVNSLSAGVGSNDIGLDRNQLGDSRIVKFVRSGPKVLLVQPNYQYRAVSDNADERGDVQDLVAVDRLHGDDSM